MSSKGKMTFSAAVFMAVAILSVYFLIFPTLIEIDAAKQEILKLKGEAEAKYVKNIGIKDLFSNLKKAEYDIQTLNMLYIRGNNELEFVNRMEELAAENNLEIRLSFQPEKTRKDQLFSQIPFSISTEGDYRNIMKYISAIESADYQINVEKISLASGSVDESGRSIISLNCSGNIYMKN